MGELLKGLISIFSGGAGAVVGNIVTLGSVLAALAPLALFLTSDKSNAVFVTVSYRDAAFWGVMFAAMLTVAWMTRRSS
jgi:hypothetical protein